MAQQEAEAKRAYNKLCNRVACPEDITRHGSVSEQLPALSELGRVDLALAGDRREGLTDGQIGCVRDDRPIVAPGNGIAPLEHCQGRYRLERSSSGFQAALDALERR